jgi:hypothetical protein
MQISDSALLSFSYSNSFVSDRRIRELQLTTLSMPSGTENSAPEIIEISAEAQKAYYSSREFEMSGLSVITSTEGDSAGLQLIGTAETVSSKTSGVSSQLSSVTAVSSGRDLPTGWNVKFSSAGFHYENEQIRVSISGSVTTKDGREISFTLDLAMQREYASIEQETVTARAVTTDPLIINFGSGLPGLSDAKFEFDINSDGSAELISATASGSGFLAFDSNNDGRINNGSELFGPTTGSGFSELSAYDSDLNGWIDENDEIFSKLSIWTKDEAGNDSLLTLKEAGIGALSLNAVTSPFSLTDDANQLNGQVKSTGIFLTEQGKVGVMQQIDLAEETVSNASASDESDTRRQAVSLSTNVSDRLKNIGDLAATASWLADKSAEMRQSFKEYLARERKEHGSSKDSDYEKLGSIGEIVKSLNESVKAHSPKSREHIRSR